MPTRNRINPGRKPVVVTGKRVKNKKEKILIEVSKEQVIGEFINGFEVIKPVKRFGKHYVLVKNKF